MKHLTCVKSYFSLQQTQPFIMIISTKTLLLTSLLCWAAGTAQAAEKADNSEVAAGQHAVIAHPGTPPLSNTSATPHVDSRWFSSAGMGLFIHYGIASAGCVELSWAMIKDATFNQKNRGVITPNTYYALAPQMTAANYHPERWLKAAKEAGFGYAVLTTKHHDGYTLWPSAYGEMGVRKFLPGSDLVKEFVTACRNVGLRVGLYYSPPDWHFERHTRSWRYKSDGTAAAPYLDMNHEPVGSIPPVDTKARADYLNGQLRELLTNYGPLDYLWFDGSCAGLMDQASIRQLQPGMLMNERQHSSGDVITYPYEVKLPETRPEGLWEHCFLLQPNWGYTRPVQVGPLSTMTERLARCRSWGGNVLANFGPQPDGEMPPEYYNFMKDMAGWMSWAAPAVTDVLPAVEPERCNLPTTVRGSTWYVFLPANKSKESGPSQEVRIACEHKPKSITVLRTGKNIESNFASGTLVFTVPGDPEVTANDLVAVEWE